MKMNFVQFIKISKVGCGNISGIPEKIPSLTSDIVFIIQIVVPIILVIVGTIDFVKAITAGKDDEIKKGQQSFIKRLIAGALVFFVIVITKFLVSVVNDSSDSANIASCMDCFLSGEENCKKE